MFGSMPMILFLAARASELALKRKLSLPVSRMRQRWVRRSRSTAVNVERRVRDHRAAIEAYGRSFRDLAELPAWTNARQAERSAERRCPATGDRRHGRGGLGRGTAPGSRRCRRPRPSSISSPPRGSAATASSPRGPAIEPCRSTWSVRRSRFAASPARCRCSRAARSSPATRAAPSGGSLSTSATSTGRAPSGQPEPTRRRPQCLESVYSVSLSSKTARNRPTRFGTRSSDRCAAPDRLGEQLQNSSAVSPASAALPSPPRPVDPVSSGASSADPMLPERNTKASEQARSCSESASHGNRRPKTMSNLPRGWDKWVAQPNDEHMRILRDGTPYGTRTRVSAVKGRRPGPLDEGRGTQAADILARCRSGKGVETRLGPCSAQC